MISNIRRALLCSASLVALLSHSSSRAQDALPTGGEVKAGSASIGAPTNGALTINQTSGRAVIDWRGFSVGQGNTVTFQQPGAGSATLNRVTGSTPSTIAGNINANGSVFLVNPNGIQITPTGTVKVGGGFVGSALDIGNADFMAGRLNFNGNGASASVDNAGKIIAGPGGFVALLGGTVSNSGKIVTRMGKIGLGSGEQAMLDLNGDHFLQVAVPTNAKDQNGKALVTSSGKLSARGGNVVLSAATARNAVRNAINMPGKINASSVSGRNGSIVLGGGAGGRVAVSGSLKARGGKIAATGASVVLTGAKLDVSSKTQKGGDITVTAVDDVRIAGAALDASGKTGGGTVLIGGEAQGGGTLQQAASLSFDGASTIKADATGNGNGGQVVLWSTGETVAKGLISAMGGPNGGDGGLVETSGHAVDFNGFSVNSLAPLGIAGTWLIDPIDLTVDAAAAATISTNLQTSSVSLQTEILGADGAGIQSAGLGDIIINAPINWNANTALIISAWNNIYINASITAQFSGNSSGLSLRYGRNAIAAGNPADYYVNAPINLVGGSRFSTVLGSNGSILNYTVITAVGAAGDATQTSATASTLQGLAGPNVTGNYAIGRDIATDTANWNARFGWTPIPVVNFTIAGLGHKLYNLTTVRLTSNGAFASVLGQSGIIRDIGLVDPLIIGNTVAAGLVGESSGTIIGSYVSGGSIETFSNPGSVGGIVGDVSGGRISRSFVKDTIIKGFYAGGLAGRLLGSQATTISDSYTIADIRSTATNADILSMGHVGGLIGAINQSNPPISVRNSYSASRITSSGFFTGAVVGSGLGGGAPPISYQNVYFDAQVFGAQPFHNSTGVISGMTTDRLKDGTLLAGLSSPPWYVQAGSYPQLTPFASTPVTYSIANVASTYGTLATLGAITLNGVAGGDSGNVLGTIGLYDSSNTLVTLSATLAAGTYTEKLTGLTGTAASNYSLASTGNTFGTFTISPLAVTLSASKTYDGNTTFNTNFDTLTVTNKVGTDVVNLTGLASVASPNVSAGAQALTGLNGLTLSNSNYTLTGASGTASISPRAVVLSGTQTFDGTSNVPATNLTLVNSISGATAASIGLSGTGVLNHVNASVGRVLTSTGGALTGLFVTDTNFTVTGGRGTVNVNRAPLTVTVLDQTATYGTPYTLATAPNVAFAVSGLKGSDNVTGVSPQVTGTGNLNGTTATTAVGQYTIAADGLDGRLLASNYQISFTDGTLNVRPRVLDVTYSVANAQSVYGTLATLGAATLTGVTIGDAANVAANVGVFTQGGAAVALAANTAVGTYVESVTGLTGSAAGNYTIAATGNTNGMLTITPATLTITPTAQTKTYGDTGIGQTQFTTTGIVGTDTVTGVTLASTGSVATANVGTYDITASAASGSGLANYNISYQPGLGLLTVNPARITVTALGGTSVYGSNATNPGLSATGLKNRDSVSVLTGLFNSFGIGPSTSVGGYTLTVAGALANGNYAIDARNTGIWTVTPVATAPQPNQGTQNPNNNPLDPGNSGLINGVLPDYFNQLNLQVNLNGSESDTNTGSLTCFATGVGTPPSCAAN